MIITKTPFRISFIGGGTDFKNYFKFYGGAVITTSINKYMYIVAKRQHGIIEYKYKLHWRKTEFKNKISEIEHPIVREALRLFKINFPIEISSYADVPASTGLGSSSSFAVGLVNALSNLLKLNLSKNKISSIAAKIEVDILKRKIGFQDHYSTAFGNFNKITFKKKNIRVNKVPISKSNLKKLEKNLLLVYTNKKRDSSKILKNQFKPDNLQLKNLHNIKAQIKIFEDNLKKKNVNINKLSEIINKQWRIKKKISKKINTKAIDSILKDSMRLGAYGGKLLGAGGGGFILLLASKKSQNKIKNHFGSENILEFNFEAEGTCVIYNGT